MAGGIGSRFWPMSTAEKPKQFLDILGTGQTLLQQTFARFLKICPKTNIFIVTNRSYKELVLEQLPIKENQVISEPHRRNTAPCIAYASYKIRALNPNALVVVTPSDHLILDVPGFRKTINSAYKKAGAEEALITLGIKPIRPDTGYGYIQFDNQKGNKEGNVRRVKTFTEKPDLTIAKKFLDSGDFYWNSGIFIWSNTTIIAALEKHLPDIASLFKSADNKYNTPKEEKYISNIYERCKNISIDYGVMEKADSVFVVLSDFGWSDLGTWGSLYENQEKSKEKNAVVGKQVYLYESESCIVNAPDDKLMILQGLNDYIVVDANNTLLVCKKEEEQKIKQMVMKIKSQKKK
jgi:mannose-1-phosphate guanylyltransferase